jgi:hypothetical protein
MVSPQRASSKEAWCKEPGLACTAAGLMNAAAVSERLMLARPTTLARAARKLTTSLNAAIRGPLHRWASSPIVE